MFRLIGGMLDFALIVFLVWLAWPLNRSELQPPAVDWSTANLIYERHTPDMDRFYRPRPQPQPQPQYKPLPLPLPVPQPEPPPEHPRWKELLKQLWC